MQTAMRSIDIDTKKLPDFLQLEILRRKVRRAEEPNNPSLLGQFLRLENQAQNSDILGKRARLLRQCELLFDTIEDTEIKAHWRELCLNHLHHPILALGRLADSEARRIEVNRLISRARRIKVIYE